MSKRILIIHNKIADGAGADELDVLEQSELVKKACLELGYTVGLTDMDLNLGEAMQKITSIGPDLIFNLVETLDNKGEFAYIAASLFNSLQIPYSGSPVFPLLLASNKVLSKQELTRAGLPTPPWYDVKETNHLAPGKRYILKPTWEEGSLGLDESSVFHGSDEKFRKGLARYPSTHFFIEEYIEGREFNISMLAGEKGPEVLPLAEMEFHDYPDHKPRVMGFTSKWDEDSFEYTHTRRTFRIAERDSDLRESLNRLCNECWQTFGLRGYARIDFRVSKENIPYIIDVNANPCLSENGGFMAASHHAGYTSTEVIRRILGAIEIQNIL
jgi:D-alanine-D-alanine ligase